MEKISKRVNAIEEVNNNVRLLGEMLGTYRAGQSSEGSEDLMKVSVVELHKAPSNR